MSEYGSQLLLRRIALSRELRLRIQRRFEVNRQREVWTILAFDDAGDRAWKVQAADLDSAARSLARTVGVFLPSDQLRRARGL